MMKALPLSLAALAIIGILGGCSTTPPGAQGPDALGPGAQTALVAQTQVLRGEWRDAARRRSLPYKLYLPAGGRAAPVVIFSHGLGGSREAATFLLQYLAQNGFAVVALQHPGSDADLLAGAESQEAMVEKLRPAVSDPRAAVARFGDVRFAIDRLTEENASGPLAGRFDLQHIGMSGHSYGALTTLVAVGQRLAGPRPTAFQDARIAAAVVYSPNAPRNQAPEEALGGVGAPVLHFTGTADRSPFDLEATPEGRQIPFRTISGADQYLVVFQDGDHMIYSGRVQAGRMTQAQRLQTEAIERETLTFWRAYLMEDAEALRTLCDLPRRIAPIGTGEVKAERCVQP